MKNFKQLATKIVKFESKSKALEKNTTLGRIALSIEIFEAKQGLDKKEAKAFNDAMKSVDLKLESVKKYNNTGRWCVELNTKVDRGVSDLLSSLNYRAEKKSDSLAINNFKLVSNHISLNELPSRGYWVKDDVLGFMIKEKKSDLEKALQLLSTVSKLANKLDEDELKTLRIELNKI